MIFKQWYLAICNVGKLVALDLLGFWKAAGRGGGQGCKRLPIRENLSSIPMEQHGLFLNDSESLMQNNPTTRKLNFSPTLILSLNNEAQRTVIANGNVSLTFPFIQFIQIFYFCYDHKRKLGLHKRSLIIFIGLFEWSSSQIT